MDIREDVEAKRKKKKVDFAKAAEKAAKEKDSAVHAFSGSGQPLDPEGPAAAAGSSAQGKSQFVFGRIPRNIKMPTTTHPPFPGPPGVPEGEDVQNDEEAGRGLSQGSAALQRLMRGQSRRILGEEEALGFFDDNRRNNRGFPHPPERRTQDTPGSQSARWGMLVSPKRHTPMNNMQAVRRHCRSI